MFSITVHWFPFEPLLYHVQIVMFQELKDLKAIRDDVDSLKKKHSEISEIESQFSSLESTHGVSLLVQQ